MNTFIHTFSISVDITAEECRKLYCYKWMSMADTDKKKKYISSIIEFCSRGLQIHIRKRVSEEIRYDPEHHPFSMDLVVTPYKLLHQGENLGKISDEDELVKALKVLDELIDKIVEKTGINIKARYKIRRVDITCDVLTPSDEYSREIIASVKAADLPYGYRTSEPTDEEIALYGWDREDGSLFYNENQSIFTKVYDKKENLKDRNDCLELGKNGLVRFEIELSRRFLRRKGLLKKDILGKCLEEVMGCAEELFEEYFVDNLYSMSMFSLNVLYDYLEMKYHGKEKTLDKLKKFCKTAYKCKRVGVPFCASSCGMSKKVFNGCLEKFCDINISPVPTEPYCPYIPSVESLLNGNIENEHREYAQKRTRGKDVWSI